MGPFPTTYLPQLSLLPPTPRLPWTNYTPHWDPPPRLAASAGYSGELKRSWPAWPTSPRTLRPAATAWQLCYEEVAHRFWAAAGVPGHKQHPFPRHNHCLTYHASQDMADAPLACEHFCLALPLSQEKTVHVGHKARKLQPRHHCPTALPRVPRSHFGQLGGGGRERQPKVGICHPEPGFFFNLLTEGQPPTISSKGVVKEGPGVAGP